MGRESVVKQIQEELFAKDKKRILLQNYTVESNFLDELRDVLQEELRVLVVDTTNYSTFRQSMFSQFSYETSPSETAFEVGWRSHVTEVSIYSKSMGLEVVAGLQSIKKSIRSFILSDSTESLKTLNPVDIAQLYASYAWALPTLLVVTNYSKEICSFFEILFSEKHEYVPLVLVCSNLQNDQYSFRPDTILTFDIMSNKAIAEYISTRNVNLSIERILEATGGKTGLVILFVGLYQHLSINEKTVFLGLDVFLKMKPEIATFLSIAAVVGFRFIAQEALVLFGLETNNPIPLCKQIGLLASENKYSVFVSSIIWKHLLKSVTRGEKDRILKELTFVIYKYRKMDSLDYQTLAEIYIKLGDRKQVTLAFENAANLAYGSLKKAKLYKRASLFNSVKRNKLLFSSAINYYRADLFLETKEILSQINENSYSSYLLEKLSDNMNIDANTEIYFAKTEYPELLPEILQSRIYHKAGNFIQAEKLLLNCAIRDEFTSAICLIEFGQQLYARGYVENALNTLTAAGNIASKLGVLWLERKALFTCLRAANSIGKTEKVDKNYSRLIELTERSGNTKKLVSVNNLYANSLLIRQNYGQALNIYSSSLKLLSSEKDAKDVELVVLNNMSVAQRKLFLSDKALQTLIRQVQTAIGLGNLNRACFAYGNMARLFLDLWKPDEASDCLETMIEFAQLGGLKDVAETINGISSLLAFMRGDSETALILLDQAIEMSQKTGKRRRLSFNLLKKGSLLLRLKRYKEAVDSLTKALKESRAVNSERNSFVAKSKLTAASCFLAIEHPSNLLALRYSGNLDFNHKGEVMYYHWCLTGSRQSQLAAATLFSIGLSKGLYLHSYLYMLQDVAHSLPISLAETIPLLHNYPSCEQMKG